MKWLKWKWLIWLFLWANTSIWLLSYEAHEWQKVTNSWQKTATEWQKAAHDWKDLATKSISNSKAWEQLYRDCKTGKIYAGEESKNQNRKAGKVGAKLLPD